MKKSKKDQEKIKIKLIETAIDIMIQKGYEKATMREIARAAGVGDATIYNYFSCKHNIIWAYIMLRQQQAVTVIDGISDFKTFSLQEKLHTYFDTILNGYLPDREFLPIVFKLTHHSYMSHNKELKAVNDLFKHQLRTFLQDAIDSNEIPEQPIDTLIPNLLLDLYFIIIFYWMNDHSEHFNKTTELMDLLLGFAISVLKQGLIGKFMDIGSFLFRQHVFNYAQSFLGDFSVNDLKNEFKGFMS